ncbi:MAG: phosphatidate cytidylyltransferase [Phycisphaerales bacterium]|nr:phosphatidate cytidylyltransferase [Phycisphaerales bacterium]
MLRQRLLLGPVLIAALVGAVWLDEFIGATTGYKAVVLLPILTGMGILAGLELVNIFKLEGLAGSRFVTCTAIVAGVLTASFARGEAGRVSGIAVTVTVAAVVLLGALIYYSRHQEVEGVSKSAAMTLLAFVWVGLMGGLVLALRKEFDAWVMLGVIIITKMFDSGAYFTGRAIGRTKLIPWLSPGKTVEGLLGGLAVSTGLGVLGAWLCGRCQLSVRPDLLTGAILGMVFGLVGQAGDLMASLLKRDAGIKDYSGALPGFGGVMDVLDSPLLVAPVAYWLLIAVAHSG